MTTSVSAHGLRWKLIYLAWLLLIIAALTACMWVPESPAATAASRGACILFLVVKTDRILARRARTKPLV